jgi:hypothetical protein
MNGSIGTMKPYKKFSYHEAGRVSVPLSQEGFSMRVVEEIICDALPPKMAVVMQTVINAVDDRQL